MVGNATEKAERVRVALPLLLIPYLTLNALFTVLSPWNPLGVEGTTVVAFQYWFGYIGFFWGFFLAAYWLDVKAPFRDASPLPRSVSVPWAVVSVLALIIAAGVLVPTSGSDDVREDEGH